MPEGWNVAFGEDLFEIHEENGDLSAIIPRCSALYMWKRNFRPPHSCLNDPTQLLDWCRHLTDVSLGVWTGEARNHFIKRVEVEIGGSGLSDVKDEVLVLFLRKQTNRKWLIEYLASLGPNSPSLYVGETGCLIDRIRQHLCGLSTFGAAIENDDSLSWSQIDLYFYDLGEERVEDNPSQARRAIEYLTATLTLASMTRRAG